MDIYEEYDLDPSRISDQEVRTQFESLLNIVEAQCREIQTLREENQRLRDENNRLKGEQGKPHILPKNRNVSSTKERASVNPNQKISAKRRPREKPISRTVDCTLDKATLPPDAIFKGYETSIIPEVIMRVEHVAYRREKYYSPSEQKTYLASLPEGYSGQFSPSVHAAVITLKHGLKATEANIERFLERIGCDISNATISRMLTENIDLFHQEREAVMRAGIQAGTFVQTDDTMARVKGENQHAHIVCNDFFTAYSTEARKDRLTVLDVLRLNRPRLYALNQETRWILTQMNLPEKRMAQLLPYEKTTSYTEAEFQVILNQLFPDKKRYTRYQQRIQEAAYIAGYHQESDCILTLVCDDAPQFKLLTWFIALCWVHEGRHYKKLEPVIPYHQKQLKDFLNAFWEYYAQLLAFKKEPSRQLAAELDQAFDALCERPVTYQALKERMAKTKENKAYLLRVLAQPEVPLHNNAAELGARVKVRDRDIRLHSMSAKGVSASDTFLTLIETARKLGVNSIDYIHDRVSGRFSMPSLAQLIQLQSSTTAFGFS